MTQFCPHCGSQLEPDAIFCPNCGQRVAEYAGQDDFGSDYTVQLPRGTQNMAANDAAPMPTPVQSPSWGPANGHSGNGSTAQGNSYPKAKAKLFAAIGGAVAAGAVAAALVFNFVVLPKQQDNVQAAQAGQQQTSDQNASGGANQVQGGSDGTADQTSSNGQAQAAAQEEERAKADSKAAAADAQATMESQAESEFHSSLVSYYQQLSDYDSRIKSTASTFNNNFLTASLGSRESYASSASSLMSDLESTRDALYALSVPINTSYSTQFSQIKTCYDYNVSRLSCIVEAWSIDTGYSDPSSHKSEILAPISRDNNSSNHNKYKAEFDSLYPSINL